MSRNQTSADVIALVREHARITPAQTAVSAGSRQLSYAELDGRSDSAARRLLAVRPGAALVAVAAERSVELVITLLAVLKAGAAYLPLDPRYPAERLQYMLADSGADIIVTESAVTLPLPAGLPWVEVAELTGAGSDAPDTPVTAAGVPGSPAPGDLAYMIYTSGSTGLPKGVRLTRGGLANLVAAQILAFQIAPDDRVLQFASPSFDASVSEIFVTLGAGATLCLGQPGTAFDAQTTAAALAEGDVSVVTLPPSLLRALDPAAFPGLRTVISAGERCGADVVAAWAPGRRFINAYGPTEATVCATTHVCQAGHDPADPPIGTAIDGVSVYVLDERREPAADGEPGELYIGGAGVADGYHGRFRLTAERFLPDPWGTFPGARMFRTGDLARRRPDGVIEYIGRADRQVKIRGFRVEPGEVEAAAELVRGVRAAAVRTWPTADDSARLVAYAVPEQGIALTPADVRAALEPRLPAHLRPDLVIVLPELPLTPNGKTDYAALPEPQRTGGTGRLEGSSERALAAAFADVLGVPDVGPEDDFFDLGGHSLLAGQVVARAEQRLGVRVPLRALIEQRTVRALARSLDAASAGPGQPAPLPPVTPRAGGDVVPLSHAQAQMWALAQRGSADAAYTTPAALRIAGPLDDRLLARAFDDVIARHEALRTSFEVVGGQPAQRIHLGLEPFELPVHDLTGLPPGAWRGQVRLIAVQQSRQPFDLSSPPLLRAVLLRLADEEHVLVVTAHHIAADGWSIPVLAAEVTACYAARRHGAAPDLPPLAVQYPDYALWQRDRLDAARLDAERTWWRERLEGAPDGVDLPTDRPRPALQSFKGAIEPLALPANVLAGLRRLASEQDATVHMVLLAGLDALLYRSTGQEDLVVGTVTAGRTVPEVEPLVGFFVNALALRTSAAGDPTFRALLDRVRETTLDAYSHQELPFDQVVEAAGRAREPSRSPLFQVALVLQNLPESRPDQDTGFTTEPLVVDPGTSKYDLTVVLSEGPAGLTGHVEYDTELFDPGTAQRFASQLRTLLTHAGHAPDTSLSQLAILTPEERENVLALGAARAEAPAEKCLHQLVERQAAARAEAIAVKGQDTVLTYAQLNRRADAIAHHLQRQGVVSGDIVGVHMERGSGLIAALLGVLKAGAAYLPLDPGHPAERSRYAAQDARARLVMADEATSRQWQGTGIPVALAGDIPDGGVPSPAEVSPDSPAYVIYTSGSTGQPKGAILTHRNAVRLFTSTDRLFAFGPDDAWTFFHSVAFDFSVWEIWGALVHGGRLVVVPYAVSRSPEAFLEFLAAEGVTILNQTPSAFRLLDEADAAAGRATRLTLREVIFGGEALDPALLRGWARARGLNSPRLVNMYGITETTVHVTFRPVTEADIRRGGRSPIGVPLPDLEVYILDTRLEPVPVGVPGELCVAGPGLATGYLGRPEMTAERFVASPFPVSRGRLYRSGDLARWLPSGELEYLGRRDDQVKVRGFRIELGEVEAALAAQPGVRAAAVTVETLDGESHLAGHIAADADLDLVPVRRALRELLPAYMLPSRLLAYEQLPLTANGKADRRLLSEHATRTRTTGAAGNPPAAPGDWCANDSERTLLALWTRILDLSRPIGPDDDFFGLGGDSIQAIRMVGAARERGLNISIEQLFIDPSLRGLAARAEAGADSPTTADQTAAAADEQGALGALVPAGVRAVLPDDADEVFPAAALQEGMLFHSRRSPGERRFHNVTAFQLRIAWDPEAFQTAVHGLSRRHPVLRSNFLETEDGLFTVVRRDALIPVHVSDLRGAGAETRETAVDQHLERERVTPLAADQAPLARISVLLTGERELWVVLAEHHSILDGWSVASLLTELFQDYLGQCGQAPSGVPLAAPRSRYADFVAAERRTIADPAAREHWEHVTGGATPTRIGLIPAPDARTEHSDECDVDLPPGTGAGLRALAQRVGVPLRTVLLTAHVAALGLYSGERDVITGEVVNGRIDQADGDRVLGLFLNTVPLRPRLADGDWLAAVRAIARTEQASYPYRRYPLARMGDAASLFDTVFNFTHFHVYNGLRHLPGASLLEVRDFQRTDMALVANFSLDLDSSDVSLRLDADPSRLAPGRVRTIAALYRRVLTVMATRADSPWTAVAAVGDPAERAELLRDSAGPAESLAETGIAASFLARARSCPEQTALIAGRGPVSYRELAAAVAHLTGQLRLHGVQRGQVVGVCLPRSVSSVAAAMAVLAVGAVLLPLDARAPESWLAGLLRRGTARALVTSPDRAPGLAEAAAPLAVIVAEPEAAGSQAAGSETAADDSLTDLAEPGLQEPACLLFTSGSTGVPKGVLLPHRALLNRFSWMWRGLPFEAGEIMVHKTAAGFVDSLWEIFGGLLQGIPTVLLDDAVTEDPRLLVQNLAAAEVSRIVLVPSLLRVLLERYPDLGRRLPRLRWWTVSGEPLPPALAGSFRHAVPGGRLLNLYGSTEVAGDITWADLTSPDADITIGKPIDNAAAFVLDESRRLVPPGVPGRLWVGGDNLALGYAGDPDRTAADFVRAGALALPGSVLFDTGDQARRLAGGELELLGRTDHRLKVRGVRMDPVIIETVLRGLPGVRDAAVGVRRVAGEETLVAYLVGDTAPARAELRATVRAQLPDALIPQLAIRLETLPVTSSGKIDRRALAELPVSPAVPSGGGQADTASPDSVTGQALLELWRSALEEPGLGMHDDVFDHGANSLTVMRVAGQASARLGAEVPVAQLFRCPTAASMAAYLDTAGSNGNPGLPVRRVSVTDRDYDGPLAFTQERLWFLDQLDPGNPAYNVTAALRIDGHVDQEAMRAAVAQLADRHDSLRAVFTVDSGVPAQRVRAPGTPELTALEAHDLRDDLNPDAAAERLLREFAETPFDLGTGPLLRAILIRTAEAGHLFGLNVHHIACDGWSMDVIARDLMLLYVQESTGQPARLPDLPFQFADRAARDRAPEYAPLLEEGLRHWTQALTPEPPALMLPTDHPRPAVPTMRGKVARRSVDAETARVVAEMGRAHDCTLFMTLLAVFAGLLYRRTGQPDLVVGIPIANREPGMEDVVGFCANTLALRLRLDGGSPFGAVLETAREAALDGHTYQATPFEQVIDRLGVTRSTASTPLFQVMFELQESRDNLLGLAGPAGLTVRQMELPTGTSKFDLTLHAERRADGGLDLLLEYSTDLFEPATAEGWLDQYCLLLDNATRLAGCRTDSLPILTADQEAALLRSGRGDVRDWPDASFAGLFARQARLRAAAPAVSDGTTVLSYAELDRRSSAVTAQLQAQGVTPGSVVAISSPRDLFLLPLLLGVIRTGAAFLPLDPGLPAARRSDIVARCRPALVACAGAGLAAAAQLAGIRTADCTAATRGGETGGSGVIADAPVRPGDLAYVLFTSGSTGVPKGVMVDQRGMLNHLHAMVEALGLGAGDTLLQNAAQSFDISVWQMLAPLVYGGTVRIADDDTARDPDALARLLAAEPVQVAEVVPAVLRGLLETFERGGLRPLDTRWLLVTGEAAPGALGRRWSRLLPGIPLVNAYGPAECADDVSLHVRRDDDAPGATVPIGRAVANVRLYVLDGSLQHVPAGSVGELFVGGDAVGRGYVNDPRGTAAVFVPDPFAEQPGQRMYRTGDLVRRHADGTIEFVGREDHQVKVRGFRIELGEVEAALRVAPGVTDAVATAGGATLVGYVVLEPGPGADGERLAAIRAALADQLPGYMVPSVLVRLDALPLNRSGKVDRKALPEPAATPPGTGSQPGTPAEREVHAVWAELLGGGSFGIDDDFFLIGGHSLLATQVRARIQDRFGVRMTLRAIFEAPTVRQLAAAVQLAQAEILREDELALLLDQIDSMSEQQVQEELDSLQSHP